MALRKPRREQQPSHLPCWINGPDKAFKKGTRQEERDCRPVPDPLCVSAHHSALTAARMSCSWEMNSDRAACPLGKLHPGGLSNALQWQARSLHVVMAYPTERHVSLPGAMPQEAGPDQTCAGCAAGCNAASGHRCERVRKGPGRLTLQ